jgi:putative ABC transport system permease protein
MNTPSLAWKSLVRQPARSALGIIGIAAVGALLFDMLLLSRGLVVSFGDLLDAVGFDVRVSATDALPLAGPRVDRATAAAAELAALPEVDQVAPLRIARAEAVSPGGETLELTFMGIGPDVRNSWKVAEGRSLPDDERGWVVINRILARDLSLAPDDRLRLWGRCWSLASALPAAEFRVAGVVDFAFDTRLEKTVAVGLPDFLATCGEENDDSVDLLLVASRDGVSPEEALEAIRRQRPDLHAFSNEQLVRRFHANDFSYFRQISFVLGSVTLFFAFLLITSLLTVSVNQRFAEVAALRALGFSRGRIVTDLLIQSALLVGTGGLLALPIGGALAFWLDGILKSMQHIPINLHFFVFQPRAVLLHLLLLGGVGVAAALYPVWLAARLPIAATLRDEVVS